MDSKFLLTYSNCASGCSDTVEVCIKGFQITVGDAKNGIAEGSFQMRWHRLILCTIKYQVVQYLVLKLTFECLPLNSEYV